MIEKFNNIAFSISLIWLNVILYICSKDRIIWLVCCINNSSNKIPIILLLEKYAIDHVLQFITKCIVVSFTLRLIFFQQGKMFIFTYDLLIFTYAEYIWPNPDVCIALDEKVRGRENRSFKRYVICGMCKTTVIQAAKLHVRALISF